MNLSKRALLQGMLAVGALLALPQRLWAARPSGAFDATSADDAIQQLFGTAATASDRIKLKVPDIAENGAVVPVTISTDLENVESISVVVDNNPTALAAQFQMSPRSRAEVSLRIKMGESSPVRALVKAGGQLYEASSEVKVTIGGCGG